MGRRGGSFQFAKRQKELKKQKKRQEKLERKRDKGSDQISRPPSAEAPSGDSLESTEAASIPEPKPEGDATRETKADPDT